MGSRTVSPSALPLLVPDSLPPPAGLRLDACFCEVPAESSAVCLSVCWVATCPFYSLFRGALAQWLSWSIILCTRRLWVQFPVRAHAWVVGLIPGQGPRGRQPDWCFFLTSVFLSLPPSLKVVEARPQVRGKSFGRNLLIPTCYGASMVPPSPSSLVQPALAV